MSKIVNPQGNIEETANIEGIEGRSPVVSQSSDNAKIDPQGYLYVEKEIDGTTGRIPVVSAEGGSGGSSTPTLDAVLTEGNTSAKPIQAGEATTDDQQPTLGQVKNSINAAPYLPLTGGTLTGALSATGKILSTKGTSVSENNAYTQGNFEANVTAAQFSQGYRAGYGFHNINNFGVFLYANAWNDLRIKVSNGTDYNLWNSANLPYEAGTWTPLVRASAVAGSITYTTQVGTYVRRGNMVKLNCFVIANINTKPDGVLRVEGLPFSCINDGVNYSGVCSIGYRNNNTNNVIASIGRTLPAIIAFLQETTNAAPEHVQWSSIGNTSVQVQFEIEYKIA